MLERITFNVLAFGLFTYLFLRMIQKNDTNYIYILILQALGIAIAFFYLITKNIMPIELAAFTYIISVFLPVIVIFIEKKGMSLTETINITKFKLYQKAGNSENAKNILIKLAEKNPESYYAHKFLARIYEEEERYDIALKEYIDTLELKPSEYKIEYKISYLYNKCGKPEEAINILQQTIKKDPKWLDPSLLLGQIMQEQDRLKEAASIYLEALNYHPENYDLYYNLGMVYTRLNDFQSAKEYYQKAAQINSLAYNAKYVLGQIDLIFNELDEAENYFTECLQYEEVEDDAYFYLAYIAMLRGDEQKAIQLLNISVSENPDNYERARKELIFNLIFNKLEKPNKNNNPKKLPKISKQEKKTIEHLRKTYELVGNLSHNDIKAIQIIKDKRKEEKERE